MEKVINSYETLFIVNPSIEADAIKATTDKFTALIAEHGSIDSVNEWGKRRLAYPINDLVEGYYVLVYFKSAADFPTELERKFNIDENIMRSLVIKLDEKKMKQAEATAVPEVVVTSGDADTEEVAVKAAPAEEAAPAEATAKSEQA